MDQKSTPKDVFLQLLNIAALYASVISFITIWWQYANTWFPDKLSYYYQGNLSAIRSATSVIVVFFALYIFIAWLIEKDVQKEPGKRDIKIRKWLLYLTLFIAAITIAIDLSRLIYEFYSGSLTVLFIIKVFVILIVAGAVFGYNLWDLRRDSNEKTNIPKTFAWVTSIVVVLTIIGGFFIVGSPQKQRQIEFDNQRINHLQMIQSQIVSYWQQKEMVPTSLANLSNDISGFIAPADPENDAPYEYSVLGELSFQLCATFNQVSLNSGIKNMGMTIPYQYGVAENWGHDAGRVCFDRAIDPDIYSTNPKLSR